MIKLVELVSEMQAIMYSLIESESVLELRRELDEKVEWNLKKMKKPDWDWQIEAKKLSRNCLAVEPC